MNMLVNYYSVRGSVIFGDKQPICTKKFHVASWYWYKNIKLGIRKARLQIHWGARGQLCNDADSGGARYCQASPRLNAKVDIGAANPYPP
jgi:hypothetical protein